MDSHSYMWHRRRHPHRLTAINQNDDGIFTAAQRNVEGGVPCHRPQRFSGRESAKLSVWVLGFGSPEHPSHRTQLHTRSYVCPLSQDHCLPKRMILLYLPGAGERAGLRPWDGLQGGSCDNRMAKPTARRRQQQQRRRKARHEPATSHVKEKNMGKHGMRKR